MARECLGMGPNDSCSNFDVNSVNVYDFKQLTISNLINNIYKHTGILAEHVEKAEEGSAIYLELSNYLTEVGPSIVVLTTLYQELGN